MLALRSGRRVALLGAVGAQGRLRLEDLAEEGLRPAVAPHHVDRAELPPEARPLIAEFEVPGPGKTRLRTGRGDVVGRKGEPGRVFDDSSLLGELRLTPEGLRGEPEEVRRAVVGEAAADFQPHSLVEESIPILPDEGGYEVLQHFDPVHREAITRLKWDRRCVLAWRPAPQPALGLAQVRLRQRPGKRRRSPVDSGARSRLALRERGPGGRES